MSIDERASRTALEEEKARLLHQLDELGATPDGDLRTDLDLGEGFADAAAITAERSEHGDEQRARQCEALAGF